MGCSDAGDVKATSTNRADLARVVSFSEPFEDVRWEIFGTPEYKDGVAGPTDFVTLVFDAKASPGWPAASSTAEGVYIPPEAARPWLGNETRDWLADKVNRRLPMQDHANCSPKATMTKSGRIALAIACRVGHRIVGLVAQ